MRIDTIHKIDMSPGVAEPTRNDHTTYYLKPRDAPAPAPEKGVLAQSLDDATDSIVALEDKSTTAATGTNLQIDDEYMTVTDASDPNNLIVTRATGGSEIAAHDEGAEVLIGVTLPEEPAEPEPPAGEGYKDSDYEGDDDEGDDTKPASTPAKNAPRKTAKKARR